VVQLVRGFRFGVLFLATMLDFTPKVVRLLGSLLGLVRH
jgi:hypothetical protein